MRSSFGQVATPQVSRRALFRLSLAAAGLAAGFGAGACTRVQTPQHLLVGTRTRVMPDGEHGTWLTIVDIRERVARTVAVPFRGHSVVQHPTDPDRVYVLTHRSQLPAGASMPLPGVDSCEVSLSQGAVTRVFRCQEGHHFYGHGSFNADGSQLFTTENDFGGGGDGVITVRDVSTLLPIGRFPSHGVDPHEMRLTDAGHTAVIANGGLRSHPDYGPLVLNGANFVTNMTWVDVGSGRLLDEVRMSGLRASLRHFDVHSDGTILVALQDGQADSGGTEMPVALRFQGGEMRQLHGTLEIAAQSKQMALSAVLLPEANLGAVTHPQGGLVTFWHLREGTLASTISVTGPTGVALTPLRDGFFVGTGTGELLRVDARSLTVAEVIGSPESHMQWDSHLTNVWLPSRA